MKRSSVVFDSATDALHKKKKKKHLSALFSQVLYIRVLHHEPEAQHSRVLKNCEKKWKMRAAQKFEVGDPKHNRKMINVTLDREIFDDERGRRVQQRPMTRRV